LGAVDGSGGGGVPRGGRTIEGRRGRQGAKFLLVDENLYQFCLHFGRKRGNGEGEVEREREIKRERERVKENVECRHD